MPDLTTREYQILTRLAAGDTQQQIADAMYLHVQWVKECTGRIVAKLGARNRVHAVALAVGRGLIAVESASRPCCRHRHT